MQADIESNPIVHELGFVIDAVTEACKLSNAMSVMGEVLRSMKLLRVAVHHIGQVRRIAHLNL